MFDEILVFFGIAEIEIIGRNRAIYHFHRLNPLFWVWVLFVFITAPFVSMVYEDHTLQDILSDTLTIILTGKFF